MALTSPVKRSDSTSSSKTGKQPEKEQSTAAAAASSLALLLREDALLVQKELHTSSPNVYGYASALLSGETNNDITSRASLALDDVNRKLALVESLAERVSRTSPQAVAGPLLRLHGYSVSNSTTEEQDEGEQSSSSQHQESTTLVATRERCHRLQRQGQVLEGVAKRVESSLDKAFHKMETATNRLSRVLDTNLVLKQILRLMFESSKLQGHDLDDLRDLTRVAASVAVMQDLLSKPELEGNQIDVVEAMRPEALKTTRKVKSAAAALLEQFQERKSPVVTQLGATLQVYYHLGELPQATWSAVEHALVKAKTAHEALFVPANLTKLTETAQQQAKAAVGTKHKPGDTERVLKKKLRQVRAEAATAWATAIAHAANSVWNLHYVLGRKTDPVTRQAFLKVVVEAPIPEKFSSQSGEFSIFGIFWQSLCNDLGDVLDQVLVHEYGKLVQDVAGLYPAVRAAALHMLSSLRDTMQASGNPGFLDDATASSASASSIGILGGSAGLQDGFLEWNTTTMANPQDEQDAPHQASADTWTRATTDQVNDKGDTSSSSTTTSSLSSIFQSPEWKALQGSGLYPLEKAFIKASNDRLCEPLQYMFPSSNVTVDEDGVAISVLPTLPSRFDLQNLDNSIRLELSLADPREGGGELGMTGMLANNVVDMVKLFCSSAQRIVSRGECLQGNKIVATDEMIHDLKVSNVMSALAKSLKTAPENTFVAPYRPATSVQHEEAASMCKTALGPALEEIETMVKNLILDPLCTALNRRVANAIAKVHHGTYLNTGDDDGGGGTSFVENNLAQLYNDISQNILSKLPTEYAAIVAATIATYSIYNFCSNIALIRPLSETARLHVTQDLADFELALEQLLVTKGAASAAAATAGISLHQVHHGKPYAELRAVRQMLFWNGLAENDTMAAPNLAKSLLREVWIKDLRPSTMINYLFGFAPTILSSPHVMKRCSPEAYVTNTLVQWDGSVEDGEASAWMTTLECCDAYQQRASIKEPSSSSSLEGDERVAALVMNLGPELLRRRRH